MKPPFQVAKAYDPLYFTEPLGLMYLATRLKGRYDVSLFDCVGEFPLQSFSVPDHKDMVRIGASDKQIIARITKEKPQVIGITSPFITLEDALIETVRLITKNFPHIKIVAGGAHPSSRLELLKKVKIDVIVRGEAEETFKELLDSDFKGMAKIRGIAYLEGDEIKVTPPREPIDINEFPLPARELCNVDYLKNFIIYLYLAVFKKLGIKDTFFRHAIPVLIPFTKRPIGWMYNRAFKYHKIPSATMLTSRGCSQRCTFCSIHVIWARRYRMRDVENLIEEVDFLVREYGVRHIDVLDDNFTVSQKRVIDFCKEIVGRGYKLSLNCPSGVYIPSLNEEVLTWMKKAGFNSIQLGIESGNQEILDKVIHKNLDLKKALEIINTCKKLGMYTIGFFMMGIPGETKLNMQETLDFILKSNLDRARLYICQPMPGTPLFEEARERGWIDEGYNPVLTPVTGINSQFNTSEWSNGYVESFVKDARKQLQKAGKFKDRID